MLDSSLDIFEALQMSWVEACKIDHELPSYFIDCLHAVVGSYDNLHEQWSQFETQVCGTSLRF